MIKINNQFGVFLDLIKYRPNYGRITNPKHMKMFWKIMATIMNDH